MGKRYNLKVVKTRYFKGGRGGHPRYSQLTPV